MNEYFEGNKRSLLLLSGMLFVLALVLFFMLLRPLIGDYKREVQQIDSLNEEINLLKAQIKRLEETTEEFDLEQLILENKIPTERELDEYILAIQQLELHTESKIDSIQFTYDSSIATDATEEESEIEETEDTEAGDVDELETVDESDESTETEESDTIDEEVIDEESEEEPTAPTIDPAILSEKPEELHVMTVRISALSPDFDEFIELLKLIENNERISIVTSLNFTKPTEQDIFFEDNPLEIIPFDAEITTFYYKE